jgi:hypothetical protein
MESNSVCDDTSNDDVIAACRNDFNSAKAVDLTGCRSIADESTRQISQDNRWMKQAVDGEIWTHLAG